MIRGRIAIPDKDPKSWRSRGRKKKRAQSALTSAIVTPAPMTKRSGPAVRQLANDNEPKRKPRTTAIFGNVPDELRPGGAPPCWREGRRAVPRDRAPGRAVGK